MRDFITGTAIGLVFALCIIVYWVNDANKSLQDSNSRLMESIVNIQTEQAKQERVAEKAMRRHVRKIAADNAAND